MSDADEIKAFMEELDRLSSQAETTQSDDDMRANKARQTEIRERLAALGRPIG